MEFIANLFPGSFQPSLQPASTCLESHGAILNALPASHSGLNAVSVNQNLAVIPGDWQSGDITSSFYDVTPTEPCVAAAFAEIKNSDFIAFDDAFLDVLGPGAKLERIESFSPDQWHVNEAPVYLPESNELLYSDTSLAGLLYAINIDTHEVRQVPSDPPLQNVNGGTYHRGKVYVATNGGTVRGVFELNVTTGRTEAIVNNYRGRHLNSPNDLIFDSRSNMYFTDPTYGLAQNWPGVQAPELPNAIYRFHPHTKALQALSNSAVMMPNGLALSADEKTLYVADSNSSSLELSSQRAVFAFDIRQGGLLDSPRLIYQVESGWPDGLRVTVSGLLVIAIAGGADCVDPNTGALVGRINTPDDIIFNLEPARGKGFWLLTGKKHIYKATIKEGPVESWVAGNPPIIHQALNKIAGLWKKEL
ncbi:hypothetical protein M409DRAFT_28209 [Zasmidium cellare ATCC 36951]|uniref:SMP-30/Gluconolactonase/LRE-like region domain-containing protein n=1 Tax=Zasmidium cellare ATCC 36951 TaxID=1080233 RepID=A0A6A6C5K8_ZASCE|nr:uncharacterized protein M409DRAFT_28209 [Zasmidium cellare ATCC 36951]KAF2161480.1 hypothetical protein M409DRAFT_28209 [Zasmidium cellare ATCC 36951]